MARRAFRKRSGPVDYISFRQRIVTTSTIPVASAGAASFITLDTFGSTIKAAVQSYQEYKITKVFVHLKPRFSKLGVGQAKGRYVGNQTTPITETFSEGHNNELYFMGWSPLNLSNSDITETFMENLKGSKVRHYTEGCKISFSPTFQIKYNTGPDVLKPTRGWLPTTDTATKHGCFVTFSTGTGTTPLVFADVIYTAYISARYRR